MTQQQYRIHSIHKDGSREDITYMTADSLEDAIAKVIQDIKTYKTEPTLWRIESARRA